MGGTFDLQPGRILARKYEVVSLLGAGWEGEVYKIRERTTNIERAAKLFYPERNVRNKAANLYARKLHNLRDSPVVIQYHFQESTTIRNIPVTVLISEYVEGEMLETYIKHLPGRKLPLFQGIHLLHALAAGIESIHIAGEYHGDLHSENVMIRGLGLSYELKFLDFFHYGKVSRKNRDDDICDAIRIFYDAIGGSRSYRKHPQQIKQICCGLKRPLILKRFRSASALRSYLEAQRWN